MFNPPNSLSLLRAPLALLFIIESIPLRAFVILLAMFTDYIDGYLARRYRYTSRFGAILDPMMDKFFVYTALAVLSSDQRIKPWEITAMLSRDISLLIYLFYLWVKGAWKAFEFKSIRWGKITTATQFLTLLTLVFHFFIPSYFYFIFVLFGVLAFFELLNSSKATLARTTHD